jgi:prepilin peptidase CpaA
MHTALWGAVLVLAIAAAYTDLRWGKIFNALTLPFALLGLTLNTIGAGQEGFLLSVKGLGLGFGLWIVSSFLGRIMGGGDIKLLMAFGALQGPGFLLLTLTYGALIGGLMALVVALRRGLLARTFKSLGTALYLRAACGTRMEIADPAEAGGEVRLPYAIALAVGAMVTLAVRELL